MSVIARVARVNPVDLNGKKDSGSRKAILYIATLPLIYSIAHTHTAKITFLAHYTRFN